MLDSPKRPSNYSNDSVFSAMVVFATIGIYAPVVISNLLKFSRTRAIKSAIENDSVTDLLAVLEADPTLIEFSALHEMHEIQWHSCLHRAIYLRNNRVALAMFNRLRVNRCESFVLDMIAYALYTSSIDFAWAVRSFASSVDPKVVYPADHVATQLSTNVSTLFEREPNIVELADCEKSRALIELLVGKGANFNLELLGQALTNPSLHWYLKLAIKWRRLPKYFLVDNEERILKHDQVDFGLLDDCLSQGLPVHNSTLKELLEKGFAWKNPRFFAASAEQLIYFLGPQGDKKLVEQYMGQGAEINVELLAKALIDDSYDLYFYAQMILRLKRLPPTILIDHPRVLESEHVDLRLLSTFLIHRAILDEKLVKWVFSTPSMFKVAIVFIQSLRTIHPSLEPSVNPDLDLENVTADMQLMLLANHMKATQFLTEDEAILLSKKAKHKDTHTDLMRYALHRQWNRLTVALVCLFFPGYKRIVRESIDDNQLGLALDCINQGAPYSQGDLIVLCKSIILFRDREVLGRILRVLNPEIHQVARSNVILIYALQKNVTEESCMIINAGADVNCSDPQTAKLAWEIALSNQMTAVVVAMVRAGLDLQSRSQAGKTILFEATKAGNREVVAAILEVMPNPVSLSSLDSKDSLVVAHAIAQNSSLFKRYYPKPLDQVPTQVKIGLANDFIRKKKIHEAGLCLALIQESDRNIGLVRSTFCSYADLQWEMLSQSHPQLSQATIAEKLDKLLDTLVGAGRYHQAKKLLEFKLRKAPLATLIDEIRAIDDPGVDQFEHAIGVSFARNLAAVSYQSALQALHPVPPMPPLNDEDVPTIFAKLDGISYWEVSLQKFQNAKFECANLVLAFLEPEANESAEEFRVRRLDTAALYFIIANQTGMAERLLKEKLDKQNMMPQLLLSYDQSRKDPWQRPKIEITQKDVERLRKRSFKLGL